MTIARLDSVDAVIEALGGTAAVSRLTGKKPTTIWNWRRRHQRFPAKTRDLLQSELATMGMSAPGRLWGQIERGE